MIEVEKPELVNALATLLSDTVVYSYKLQGAHWNVEGPDFHEYHQFFEMLYEDVEGSIDPLAENIRKMGAYAPSTLFEFASMTNIKDTVVSNTCSSLTADIYDANEIMIRSNENAFRAAEAAYEQGVMDFLAGRDDMLKKWRWQLSALLKG